MCDRCEWEDVEEMAEDILEMMEETLKDDLRDTVEGIRDWVLEKKHVTEKQMQALKNIRKFQEDTVEGVDSNMDDVEF